MKNMVVIRLTVLMTVLCMGAVASATVTLNFDEETVTNPDLPTSTHFKSSHGVTFVGGSYFSDNAVFSDNAGVFNDDDGGGTIEIIWDKPLTSASFDYVLLGTFADTKPLDLFAFAYDKDGNQVDDFKVSYDPSKTPIPVYGTGALSGGLIKKIVWHDGGDKIGLDSVTYNPIPAPGALLLGTLGTGLVGWFRKRS